MVNEVFCGKCHFTMVHAFDDVKTKVFVVNYAKVWLLYLIK
jgi:hypothetical protein